MQIDRRAFYKAEEILRDVKKKVKEARVKGESVDYLTFVPDGEPTLDINLGEEIRILKQLGIKIAVITNSSLMWRVDVQDDLRKADCVSLKIDAISDDVWHRIDRPYKSLQLDNVLQGISEFSRAYDGELITETMLIQNVNDSPGELEGIANFIEELGAKKAYISIPTRPPAEKRANAATEDAINLAYQLFREKSINVEYLIGYEGNAFAFTGNAEDDLLSITSVHPMREEAINEFLKKAKADWSVIERLIEEDKMLEVKYKGKRFYMRRLQCNPD